MTPTIPHLRAVLLLAALATLLMACGTTTADTSTDQRPLATPAASTPAASPMPAKSPRGLIPKKVGEIASIVDDNEKELVRFAVTKIDLDPKCDAPSAAYTKPDHGHLVQVALTIETSAGYQDNDVRFRVSQFYFSIQGPDGFTESGSSLATFAAYSCTPESPPDTLNPSSKYVIVVGLDSKHTSGILMFKPDPLDSGGWEWAF